MYFKSAVGFFSVRSGFPKKHNQEQAFKRNNFVGSDNRKLLF